MKKLLSLALALAMSLSVAVPAFATFDGTVDEDIRLPASRSPIAGFELTSN